MKSKNQTSDKYNLKDSTKGVLNRPEQVDGGIMLPSVIPAGIVPGKSYYKCKTRENSDDYVWYCYCCKQPYHDGNQNYYYGPVEPTGWCPTCRPHGDGD